MAENNSISLEQLEENRQNLVQAVNNLSSQKAQLQEQLEGVQNALATNRGALQYANALITSITGEEAAPEVAGEEVASEEASVDWSDNGGDSKDNEEVSL